MLIGAYNFAYEVKNCALVSKCTLNRIIDVFNVFGPLLEILMQVAWPPATRDSLQPKVGAPSGQCSLRLPYFKYTGHKNNYGQSNHGSLSRCYKIL